MNADTKLMLSELPDRNSLEVLKFRSQPRKPGSTMTLEQFKSSVCNNDGILLADLDTEALLFELYCAVREQCSVARSPAAATQTERE